MKLTDPAMSRPSTDASPDALPAVPTGARGVRQPTRGLRRRPPSLQEAHVAALRRPPQPNEGGEY